VARTLFWGLSVLLEMELEVYFSTAIGIVVFNSSFPRMVSWVPPSKLLFERLTEQTWKEGLPFCY